jgi:adenosylcobyric acid synthase
MVLGTASHVGKSLIVAALCRLFAREGIRVAPFKAQNMALEAAVTLDGKEIGRAQMLQAECAGVPACAEMNPVLLKPSGSARSHVVVLGRPHGELDAAAYREARLRELFPAVVEAFRQLQRRFELVVLEGAGSPAEINLRDADIVNLRMADAADAACILVGDIDRGGVFASLVGTMELLEPHERARIAGFVINKFRGDRSLLENGVEMLERRLGIPCLGVVPYLHDVGLDDEDSLSVEDRPHDFRRAAGADGDRPLRVAVVALPALSNASDYAALASEPSVELAFTGDPRVAALADLIVVPGSRSVAADLAWLRERGLAEIIGARAGTMPLVGICGGMQMFGRRIEDPSGIEGAARADGLGILPLITRMEPMKTTVRVRGTVTTPALFGVAPAVRAFAGYEIHHGRSSREYGCEPFARVVDEGATAARDDGAVVANGMTLGSYVHGFWDDDAFRASFISCARTAAGLRPAATFARRTAERLARIDRWADHVRAAVAWDRIRELAEAGVRP